MPEQAFVPGVDKDTELLAACTEALARLEDAISAARDIRIPKDDDVSRMCKVVAIGRLKELIILLQHIQRRHSHGS